MCRLRLSPLVKIVIAGLVAVVMMLAGRSSVVAQDEGDGVARAYLFHSPRCPYCRIVIEDVLPEVEARYGDQFDVRLFDVTTAEGYAVFSALHEQVPDLPDGIPQLYISNRLLYGLEQVKGLLYTEIDLCLAAGGCDYPFQIGPIVAEANGAADSTTDGTADGTIDSTDELLAMDAVGEGPGESARSEAVEGDSAETAAAAPPLYAAYSYDPGCMECSRASIELERLEAAYPNLELRRLNVLDDAPLIEALSDAYAVPEADRLVVPTVFIGDAYLTHEAITSDALRAILNDGVGARTAPWARVDEAALRGAQGRIETRFEGFSALTVAAAGLLDGINPCAFTTIIFFVSYLALVGRKGPELLAVGGAFSLAVFLTYLLLGLGLASVLAKFGGATTIGRLIYGGTALICLGLAGFSLLDYVKVRQGKRAEIWLQLPKALKQRIHQTVRTRSRMRGFVGAAFVAGVLVSVFELACTGQVYLPTLVFMTSSDSQSTGARWTAVGYLVLYNLMFVVPLIGVFLVTYLGVNSRQLTAAFTRHLAAVKLMTAGLFSVLGVWLVAMVLV